MAPKVKPEADPEPRLESDAEESQDGGTADAGADNDAESQPSAVPAPIERAEQAERQIMSWGDRVRSVWRQQWEDRRAAWEEQGTLRQRIILGLALGALLVGFVLGLVRPKVAASLETALIGSAFIFFAGGRLLALYWPQASDRLPVGARGIVVAVGLITALGVWVQWTVSRRKADKSS
jgi:hypothetical protein